MTGAQIITKFGNMVDDTLDSDFMYQLLNDAKDEIEAMLTWEQLKRETTYSIAGGYSFTSVAGVLPSRFALPVRMIEDSSYLEYDKFDFDDRHAKANAPYGYFIDLSGGNVHLTGSNHSAKTMYFYYTTYSEDITSGTSWAFPERFHALLPYKMAEMYYPSDAGERSRSWDDKWADELQKGIDRMAMWNDKLKLANRTSRNTSRAISPKAVY